MESGIAKMLIQYNCTSQLRDFASFSQGVQSIQRASAEVTATVNCSCLHNSCGN